MRFRTCFSRSGGTGKLTVVAVAVAIAAVVAVAMWPAASHAGDTLSITGSSILPETSSAATAGALPQTPTVASKPENPWLAGLHVSGYLSQQFGLWQDPQALREFTPSRNSLSVARTLLQVDENYRLNDKNNFFAREWFVYEPPYDFDSNSEKKN